MERLGKRRLSFLTAITMGCSLLAAAPQEAIKAEADYGYQPVVITADKFPDATFRSYVLSSLDKDHNGTLNEKELLEARNIYVEGKGISSLKGIEYLPELRGIYCRYNNITSIDTSQNKLLAGIWCSENPLTTLDFSNNPDLEWVYASFCNLTSLNVSKNPKMSYIECNSNKGLTSINVRNNTALEHLMVGDCGLSSLDLSQNPRLSHLDAFRNYFKDPKKVDVSKNTKMKRLSVWDNPGLGTLDISKNKELQFYSCANNDVTSLDVSNNPNLETLNCAWNDITKLDLSNNPKLTALYCNDNPITKLDISKNPKLIFLQAHYCSYPTLDIGNCPGLVKVYNKGAYEPTYYNGSQTASEWKIDCGDDLVYFLSISYDVQLKGTDKPMSSGASSFTYTDIGNSSELMTREMAIQTIYDLAGKPRVLGAKSAYKDVVAGSWYEDAVIWGEENNIVFGFPDYSSDTFGVGKWITREDAALMLYRYSLYKDYYSAFDYGSTDNFMDYFDVDYYAWNSVTWAIQWGVLIPKGNTSAPLEQQRIAPHGTVTRSEFEYMINAMYDKNGMSHVKAPIPDVPSDPGSNNNNGKVKYGDANKDGAVNLNDLGIVQQYICNWNVPNIDLTAADVNLDGVVNLNDLGILQQYLCGWNVKLGVRV